MFSPGLLLQSVLHKTPSASFVRFAAVLLFVPRPWPVRQPTSLRPASVRGRSLADARRSTAGAVEHGWKRSKTEKTLVFTFGGSEWKSTLDFTTHHSFSGRVQRLNVDRPHPFLRPNDLPVSRATQWSGFTDGTSAHSAHAVCAHLRRERTSNIMVVTGVSLRSKTSKGRGF